MKFSLIAFAALASTAVADLASIQKSLGEVSKSVDKVKSALDGWKGDLIGTLPVVAASAELVITLEVNTLKIKKSANLTEDEAIEVAGTTAELITNTQPVLDGITAAKPKFDKLLLSPVIYLSLLTQKSATLDLSAAVVSKIPETFAEIGEALIAEISGLFDTVIAVYKPF